MKISKKDLLKVNEGFGGNLRNCSSLEYAIDMQENSKFGPYKKLAFLFRAILVDHPFSDGNKRTAAFVASVFAKEHGKIVNRELLIHHIVSIAKKNIINLRQIEWRLKNAIN